MAFGQLVKRLFGVEGERSQPTASPDSRELSTRPVNGANYMSAIDLGSIAKIDGFIGACLVDSDSGMVLAMEGGGTALNLEMAAAGNTEVVKAKRKTIKMLGLRDTIEDILISLGGQYHLIRPLVSNDALFLYVALDRGRANLGMARMELKSFENEVDFS